MLTVRSSCIPLRGYGFSRIAAPAFNSGFYAIYLFVVTRHGVSGKELQRALGVTYKTAWRMGHQIRILMSNADGFEILRGHVELDEAYIGGKRSGGKRGRGAPGKTIVIGVKERGGRMIAGTIPNIKMATLRGVCVGYRRVRHNCLDGRAYVLRVY